MKRINEILPKAMHALMESDLLIPPDKKSIPKEYDGYVASFAPSVITAGLKATLSFYTDNHKSSPKRVKILNLLYAIYKQQYNRLQGNDLLSIALDTNAADERQLRKDLIDCAIALKLVMRNFEQIDAEPKNQNPAQP